MYLTVPFGRHADHAWLQVFNAVMLDELIDCFCPASVREDHFRYDAQGWMVSSREESRSARYFDIHKQDAANKQKPAASEAISCLAMFK